MPQLAELEPAQFRDETNRALRDKHIDSGAGERVNQWWETVPQPVQDYHPRFIFAIRERG